MAGMFFQRGKVASIRSILIGIFILTPFVGRAAGLIDNSDFEIPYKNNPSATRPDGWSQWVDENKVAPSKIVQQYLSTGGINNSRCLKVGRSYENYLPLMYGSDNVARFRNDSDRAVPVSVSKYYKFTAWYKTENVTGDQAEIDLDMLNGSTYIDTVIYYLPVSTSWKEFKCYFVPRKASDRGFDGIDTTAMRFKLGAASTMGYVYYDNASLVEVTKTEFDNNYPLKTYTADSLTARRPMPPAKLTNTSKTFIVTKYNNVWWFVRPDGRPFWMRGVPNTGITQTINPELYKNIPADQKENGHTNSKYQMNCFDRLGKLGFNAGAITDGCLDVNVHEKGEVFFCYLCVDYSTSPFSSYTLRDKDGDAADDNKPMPDPYNPYFWTALKNAVRADLDDIEECYQENGVSHPDFAGYYTDNEMGVENLDRYIWSTYCKAEFIAWCRTKYGNSISALNNAWSSDYATFALTSFDQIPNYKDRIIRHHMDDPLYAVLNEFIKKMLKDYFRGYCKIIRDYELENLKDSNHDGVADQKHIIMTNRFDFSRYPNAMNPDIELAMDAIKELCAEKPGYYFNVLAVTNYPGEQKFEGISTKSNFAYLEKLSQRCGLPAFVAEFGVHARDCGFPTGNPTTDDIGWFWRSVNTQSDRAKVYDRMVRQYASSPYIVGAQWFQWYNIIQSKSGPTTLPVNTSSIYYMGRNSGVIDNTNTFYSALSNQMKTTNAALDAAYIRNASQDWSLYE